MSRRNRPKHFLRLFNDKSLLRISYERLAEVLPPSNIWVITRDDQIDGVTSEIPEIPREHLIGEPAVCDTANAIGLAAMILQQCDPNGVMGVFTADHIIRPVDRFAASIRCAYDTAENHPDSLVTLGVVPTQPHTGYGYLHRGQLISPGAYEVRSFREKPDRDTATAYLKSGEYFWNSGMFVWRVETILKQLERLLPANYSLLRQIVPDSSAGAHDSKKAGADFLRRLQSPTAVSAYSSLPRVSIDFGVMEKSDRVLMCTLDCDWLDVGSWTSLEQILSSDSAGQIAAVAPTVSIDSQNNILVGDPNHLIATIGVENLVVVHTADATLICPKDQVQKIKNLLDRIPKEYQ